MIPPGPASPDPAPHGRSARPAPPSVHVFSMHTSPLARPGSGDAGGMNVYVAQLCAALAAQGSAVEAFTLLTDPEQAPDGGSRSTEVRSGFRVHEVFLPEFAGAAKEDLPEAVPAFARACAGIAREGGLSPDIVHAHYWLSAVAAGTYRRDLGSAAPLVLTLHTSARVKNAHAGAGEPLEPEDRARAEAQVLDQAGAVVVNTPAEAEQLADHYGTDPAKLHVIEPGADLSVFHPAEDGLQGSQGHGFRVVFAGRPQPLKGPEILVRAVALARDRVPGLSLEIRGTPSAQYRQTLLHLVENLGVQDLCTLTPASSAEDLAEAMRRADLVACPSSSETFGLVALEAQACGTAVAVSDVSGLRAATAGGTSGHVVPERSPRAWSAALVALAGDTEYRRRLGRAGLAHARTLTWERAARATEALYLSLCPAPADQEPTA